MSVIPKVNFTCSYEFYLKEKRHVAFDCFGSVNPVYRKMLDGSTSAEKITNLPSCDFACENSGAYQPNYEQFMSLNRSVLDDFCRNSNTPILSKLPTQQICPFNVVVNFDFEKLVWTTESGEPITDINWSDAAYPLLSDKLNIVLYE